MENNNEIVMKYISIWAWQIISMLFLITTFILLAVGNDLFRLVGIWVCIFLFITTQVSSLYRQRRLLNE